MGNEARETEAVECVRELADFGSVRARMTDKDADAIGSPDTLGRLLKILRRFFARARQLKPTGRVARDPRAAEFTPQLLSRRSALRELEQARLEAEAALELLRAEAGAVKAEIDRKRTENERAHEVVEALLSSRVRAFGLIADAWAE